MNKVEIKNKVKELLVSGTQKSEVFRQLSGKGIKDNQLAYLIAAYADPERCSDHGSKVNILIALMFVQSVGAFLMGFYLGMMLGPNAAWITGGLIALVPLLFAWGFYHHRVGAYNAYILLTIIQLPKSFEGFSENPFTSAIGIALNIALLTYVWYVREKIFPGFTFITPKKVKGEYVFEG